MCFAILGMGKSEHNTGKARVPQALWESTPQVTVRVLHLPGPSHLSFWECTGILPSQEKVRVNLRLLTPQQPPVSLKGCFSGTTVGVLATCSVVNLDWNVIYFSPVGSRRAAVSEGGCHLFPRQPGKARTVVTAVSFGSTSKYKTKTGLGVYSITQEISTRFWFLMSLSFFIGKEGSSSTAKTRSRSQRTWQMSQHMRLGRQMPSCFM